MLCFGGPSQSKPTNRPTQPLPIYLFAIRATAHASSVYSISNNNENFSSTRMRIFTLTFHSLMSHPFISC